MYITIASAGSEGDLVLKILFLTYLNRIVTTTFGIFSFFLLSTYKKNLLISILSLPPGGGGCYLAASSGQGISVSGGLGNIPLDENGSDDSIWVSVASDGKTLVSTFLSISEWLAMKTSARRCGLMDAYSKYARSWGLSPEYHQF